MTLVMLDDEYAQFENVRLAHKNFGPIRSTDDGTVGPNFTIAVNNHISQLLRMNGVVVRHRTDVGEYFTVSVQDSSKVQIALDILDKPLHIEVKPEQREQLDSVDAYYDALIRFKEVYPYGQTIRIAYLDTLTMKHKHREEVPQHAVRAV